MKKLIYTLVFLAFAVCLNAQWQPDVRLTNASGSSYTSPNHAWSVASNGNVVHVLFYDDRDGNEEIYYKRSNNGGTTWGAETRLTNNTASSQYPSISIFGTLVHAVWQDNRDSNWEVYYKRSTDGGTTWGADTRLTNNSAFNWHPSMAVSGSNVHIVWRDNRDGNQEIYYKLSTDGGTTWGADLRLTNNSAFSWMPCIAVSSSNVHVVWQDNRDGNYEIYYKRSPDGGISWGADTRLTNNTAISEIPTIASSGSFVHVVWEDRRDGNYEIYYKRSPDGGISWGVDTRLTNNSATSDYPCIAVSNSNLHIVWFDNRDGNTEIYYKPSTDGGISWELDTRLTNNNGASEYPSIAVSDALVNVVWRDNRDGNWEVYYKRNTFIPSAPVLVSPPNNATNQVPNLLLDWNSVQYAESYRVQIANDSLFTSMVFDTSNVNRDSLRVRLGLLIVNTKYYWRVNASNVSGTGPWSTVWNFRTNPTGLNPIGNEIPEKFALLQNYPNPFNPSTKIRFSIPSREGWQRNADGVGLVTLKVFDISGKEVATLVNEHLQPGTYETDWNASAFSSGVYFYKIVAGNFSETRKMILMK